MSGPKLHLSRDTLLSLLKQMIRVRRFEEKCVELYQAEMIRGFLHLDVGEEAICTAVMAALTPEDAVVATYREHGHALVRGVPARDIMAEMYGKIEGVSRGRGGSMHLFSAAHRFYGGYAIVGGGLPLAAGLALADKMQKKNRVTVCFFGEGAVAEGEFHETMNLSALWKLPILFVCENNLYAMGTRLDISESETDIHLKAQSYRIGSESIDGMDVIAVDAAASRALAEIRNGSGPHFIECRTYRFRAHSMFDPQLYRTKAEVEEWKARDPIPWLANRMREAGMLHENDLEAIEGAVSQEIEDAVAYAQRGSWEPVAELARYVYAEAGS
ncbi:MAG: pyruvate dehydrogenase (acetyl-transferring) E1 component subunit alpha [Alphaproteobacteria bacterium]|nr:pyruvate dehydrogenase (acetyl-transferring) E1 component subunit alpha [Alphaproteobacteria bacterium]